MFPQLLSKVISLFLPAPQLWKDHHVTPAENVLAPHEKKRGYFTMGQLNEVDLKRKQQERHCKIRKVKS